MNRSTRRALRRMLQKERCGACGGEVDELAHEAELLGPGGQRFEHWICGRCFSEGLAGEDARRAVAARARLRLTAAEGGA